MMAASIQPYSRALPLLFSLSMHVNFIRMHKRVTKGEPGNEVSFNWCKTIHIERMDSV